MKLKYFIRHNIMRTKFNVGATHRACQRGLHPSMCIIMVVEAHSIHCDIFEVMTISDIELAHIPYISYQ